MRALRMTKKPKAIALEARLRNCKHVVTLGVRSNFSDYSPPEAALIPIAFRIKLNNLPFLNCSRFVIRARGYFTENGRKV